jgi:hypothetical protein
LSEVKLKKNYEKYIVWYEDQKVDLGKEFLQEALQTIDGLQVAIVEHRKFIKEVRVTEINRFPYHIFYIKNEEKKHISIIAVLGEKQDVITQIQKRV